MARRAERVQVSDLIDLDALSRARGRPPTPAEIRAALPRGWVLDQDGVHARNDWRLLFREGWVLVVGMACFGAAGTALVWSGLPSGWAGLAKLAAIAGATLVAGGIVAPMVTRSLARRTGNPGR
jgi:hypothetical protein